MNKELDTNSGNNQRKPKAFKDLYNELGLIDTYRKYNKKRKGYTFFRVEEEGNLVKSRVDYVRPSTTRITRLAITSNI